MALLPGLPPLHHPAPPASSGQGQGLMPDDRLRFTRYCTCCGVRHAPQRCVAQRQHMAARACTGQLLRAQQKQDTAVDQRQVPHGAALCSGRRCRALRGGQRGGCAQSPAGAPPPPLPSRRRETWPALAPWPTVRHTGGMQGARLSCQAEHAGGRGSSTCRCQVATPH